MAHGLKHRERIEPAPPSRRVQTEAQFRKCDACGETLFVKELLKALDVCKVCGHHFKINSTRRIEVTLDPDSFKEIDPNLESIDPLEFKGRRPYRERLKDAQRKTGLKDAVVCGEGSIEGIPVVIAVMDYYFIGASMGSVVGEKITRAIELATEMKKPVILVCCSGGARMDEGVLSLMQMAKTSAALYRHHQAGLICIDLLTDPTLAGVSASFAFLGDLIIAEPRAMIGFTGARVIMDTIKKQLPEGFQESEFLLEHGQIDMVVERKNMRQTLANILKYVVTSEPKPVAEVVTETVRLPHANGVAKRARPVNKAAKKAQKKKKR